MAAKLTHADLIEARDIAGVSLGDAVSVDGTWAGEVVGLERDDSLTVRDGLAVFPGWAVLVKVGGKVRRCSPDQVRRVV